MMQLNSISFIKENGEYVNIGVKNMSAQDKLMIETIVKEQKLIKGQKNYLFVKGEEVELTELNEDDLEF